MVNDQFIIGSHVSMKGKDMLLGSAKEAESYGENAFMIYTGAPQNTRRKSIDKMNISAGRKYMNDHHIKAIVIHAPYIINLANTKKASTFQFGVSFLKQEIERADAIGAKQIVLHPGSHVGAGSEKGIEQIIKGLNQVIKSDQNVQISLETMAGKGTEIGRNFEELAKIINGVKLSDKLSVTFDTCHTNDAGYNVKNDFDGVMKKFDEIIGINRIKVIHLNDSKNKMNSHKDRHEVIGFGSIGFDSLNYVAHYSKFVNIPKIMETPSVLNNENKKVSPHGLETSMLKKQKFNPEMLNQLKSN